MALAGKKTGEQSPVRRQPGPRATPAKGRRDGSDDSKFHPIVRVSEAVGDFAEMRGRNSFKGRFRSKPCEDFLSTHNHSRIPMVVVSHIHEFDEPQRNSCGLEMKRHGQDLRIVYSPLHDHVDFDPETRVFRRLDAFENLIRMLSSPVHASENIRIQSIKTHCDAVQAGLRESRGKGRQEQAVCGHSQVVDFRKPFQTPEKFHHAATHKRLTACESDFPDSTANECPDEALQFFELDELVLLKKRVLLIENLSGHAIGATEVALIGERDTEVSQRACQKVFENRFLLVRECCGIVVQTKCAKG